MVFIKKLAQIVALCVLMALLLATIPLVASAELKAQAPVPVAAQSPSDTAMRSSLQAPAASAADRPVGEARVGVQTFVPVSAVPAVLSGHPVGVAVGAVQAPVQPAVVASSQQAAHAAAVHDVEAAPMRAGKWVEVVLDEQRLIAWEDGRMVMTTLVSTGTQDTPTIKGTFRIYRKLDMQRMSGSDYDLPNVPYVMYFKGSYAMHGTYWHNSFGQPMSHGCINIPTGKAAWLYAWAPKGTVVVVH